MKRIKQFSLAALLVTGLGVGLSPVLPAHAADLDPCTIDKTSTLCTDKATDIDSVFTTIVNVLLFIIGAISVIVIIIAGIRYTSSGGNANAVAGAKNMLLYGIVGLVVAIFAFAVVSFVVDRTMSPTNTSTSTTP